MVLFSFQGFFQQLLGVFIPSFLFVPHGDPHPGTKCKNIWVFIGHSFGLIYKLFSILRISQVGVGHPQAAITGHKFLIQVHGPLKGR